jgi:hypothetical protein
MRGTGLLLVVTLSLPLAGCLGVTIPPKPLPDWAMQPQAREMPSARERAAARKTTRIVVRRRAPEQSAAVSYVGGPRSASETKPFSPEWAARENSLDDRLRRRMHICGNC